ncbi:unnamed protein product [Brachionus calyciflorus]|uniref:Uncharacterized protein n=1 Tax=Brachionus calyciflorus TaxID=104777 RepID=A0A813MTL5_9BILA|nr:unnamed protein product [Brachionus calyciflorus]
MIRLIESKSWNEAKKFWLVDVCKFLQKGNTFDCFGSVYEYFGKHIQELQLFYENSCNSQACGSGRLKEGFYIEFKKIENIISLDLCENYVFCTKCGKFYKNESSFKNVPPFLIIDTRAGQEIFVQDARINEIIRANLKLTLKYVDLRYQIPINNQNFFVTSSDNTKQISIDQIRKYSQ